MKLSEIQAAGVMPVNAISPVSAVIKLTEGQMQMLDEGKFNFIEYNGSHYSITPLDAEKRTGIINLIEVER